MTQTENKGTEIRLTTADEERFWPKIDRNGPTQDHMDTPCWVWTACKNRAGYGAFKAQKKQFRAHRVIYTLIRGPIPHDGSAHGICVCHRCDVRECCNPDHLFLGTNEDNVHDMYIKGRQPKGYKNGAHTKPECVLRGEANGHARLTTNQILEIRALYASGCFTHAVLAARFNVSPVHIGNIINRKKWAHIPDDWI